MSAVLYVSRVKGRLTFDELVRAVIGIETCAYAIEMFFRARYRRKTRDGETMNKVSIVT